MKQAIIFLAVIIITSLTAIAQTPKTTVIWEYNPPSHDFVAIDGNYYRRLRHNDLLVVFHVGGDDKFIMADVMIANNSEDQILVDPQASVLTLWKEAGKKADILSPIPPEKIAKDITRRARRASAARIFAGAFSTATGNPDRQEQIGQQNATKESEATNQAADVMDGALKANTVSPGEYVSGTIYFQRKKYEGAHFEIQIGDTVYNFNILPPAKQ